MGMDDQPELLGKLALCLSSCRVAKDAIVMERGIGEDLPFTLFGWCGDELVVMAQLHPVLMSESHEKRLSLLAFCCAAFRGAWGVDSITFMAEAYCSSNPAESVGKDLGQLFADSEQSVSECLTFTHVGQDDVSLILLPYSLGLGRRVLWGDPSFQRGAVGLRDSVYPSVIMDMLGSYEVRVPEGDRSVFLDVIAGGLVERGFSVQYDF